MINYFSIPPNFPFQLKLCWVISNTLGRKIPRSLLQTQPQRRKPTTPEVLPGGRGSTHAAPKWWHRAVPALSLVPLTQFPLRSGLLPISVHQADVTDAGKAALRPHSLPPSPPCHMASIHARPQRVCSLTTDTD